MLKIGFLWKYVLKISICFQKPEVPTYAKTYSRISQ
jgi:hypothetical protein